MSFMELRHLLYFSTVADLRSFSKAAVTLRTTQPSLSRQVATLELELGCVLFNRTSRGATLTLAGAALHHHLGSVFSQLEQIPEIVRVASAGKELIRIGVPQGFPHGLATTMFDAIEKDSPNVNVSLQEATTDEQRQLLEDGRIQIGLIHMDAPEFHCIRIHTQRMGVAVTIDSPLAGKGEARLMHLSGLTVMAHATGEINADESRLRSASAAIGANTQWVFRRFSEHSGLIAMTSKVDAVLMTEESSSRHLPGWIWIPLKDASTAQQDLSVITWVAWREPAKPVVVAAIDAIKRATLPKR